MTMGDRVPCGQCRPVASSRVPDFFTGSTGDREVREELIADCAVGSTRLTGHLDASCFWGAAARDGLRFGLLAAASLVADCLEIFSQEDQPCYSTAVPSAAALSDSG